MNTSAQLFTHPPEFLTEHILYRDALALVINKPAGIPVHRGTGGGENLEQYFDAIRFGLPNPPALAHRLDRDTSGCLVLGRQRHGLQILGKLFAIGKVKKTYWAIVSGTPPNKEGVINLPLAKQSQSHKRWWMKVSGDGQPAATEYRILGTSGGCSWLELTPLTGRTHQLRVHCAAIGCPIAGDRIYGAQSAGSDPDFSTQLQLHARAVSIPLYPKKPPVTAEAPPPGHMQDMLLAHGWPVLENENANI